MTRAYNFSPGPAMLPDDVLRIAASEMLDWRGSGMSPMEMSHRGSDFMSIYEEALRNVRELLAIPSNFQILFMQGGGIGENAIVPMNLSRGGAVDLVVTGAWSQKSAAEAERYCKARVAASGEAGGFTDVPPPSTWSLRPDAAYVHVCSNETIHGVEMHELPDLKQLGSNAPLVVDCSSHILSRTIDWSRVGLAFAGAQKNIGPSGVTLVFVREDLIGHAMACCPSAFDYRVVAENDSMYNTPPTFAIYIAGLVFQWVKQHGGVAEMERRAIERSTLLYNCLDRSEGFYSNGVVPAARSRMNVPFFLRDESLNGLFLAEAQAHGLANLKGHSSVGGMRASIYNAMPLAGVQALVDFLRDFARRHG